MRRPLSRTYARLYIYIYISIVTARPLSPQEGASPTLAPIMPVEEITTSDKGTCAKRLEREDYWCTPFTLMG